MKIARNHLTVGVALLVTAFTGLVACAPAALPPTPTLAPAALPPTPTLAPTDVPAPTTAPTTAPAQAAAFTIELSQKDQLGKFLADGQGRTL